MKGFVIYFLIFDIIFQIISKSFATYGCCHSCLYMCNRAINLLGRSLLHYLVFYNQKKNNTNIDRYTTRTSTYKLAKMFEFTSNIYSNIKRKKRD